MTADVILDAISVVIGIATAYYDEKPHFMLIEYNPDAVNSIEFVNAARKRGLHAELIGF